MELQPAKKIQQTQQIQQQKIQQHVDTWCEMADDSAVISSMDFDPPRKQSATEGPNMDPTMTLWSSILLP